MNDDANQPPVPLGEATRVWLRVGLLSFGGPAGQIATMHQIVVEEKGWIDERRFLDALNFCNLLPGPEAQQLATYIGWMLHGVRGGLIAGGLFILPGFIVLLGLSALYVAAVDTPLVAGALDGLKPAVISIIAYAVIRIGRRALRSRLALALAAGAFVALFFFRVPFPVVVALAALTGASAGYRGAKSADTHPTVTERADGTSRPSRRGTARTLAIGLALWWVPIIVIAAIAGGTHVLTRAALFFSQAAVVTFGGAYAVLAWVSDRAVHQLHWLTPTEMLDGLALAETTPGPLILVLQFVGFVAGYRFASPLEGWAGGILGAIVTIWATFVPSFLFVLLGAPWMEWLRTRARLQAALAAVSAAIVGVILNLSVWFAIHALFRRQLAIAWGPVHIDAPVIASVDAISACIALLAFIALARFRVSLAPTIAAAAAAGVARALLA